MTQTVYGQENFRQAFEKYFAGFPVEEKVMGKRAELQIAGNAKAKKYQTSLKRSWSGAKEPNFAGHYWISQDIGCGTGCQVIFVVDWKTGKIVSPPEDHAAEFRKNSRVLILKPYESCTAYGSPQVYEFNSGKFKLLQNNFCP